MIAVRLAQDGADVIAVDICRQIDSVAYPLATPADLARTVSEVEDLGRRIVAAEGDVRDAAALQAAVASGVERLGSVDIVVAVQQQRHHHFRVERRPAVPISPVPAAELAKIQGGHRVQHDEDQIVPGQPSGESAAMTPASVWSYCEAVRQTTGFARLPDGQRIAFAVVGSGPPVVLPAWWVSSVVEDWHFDPLRRFVEGLAAGRMVVRYDRLGTGLSDRERPPETFTPEFEDATLCAVLDQLGLERVTLMGISSGGCTAVSFAARRPERVDRLVLYGSYARGNALGPPEARAGMIDLVRSHWGLGSRLLADVFGPNWPAEDRAVFTGFQRAAADAEVAADLLALIYETDVRGELPMIRAPALVVHREYDRAMRLKGAREVAALLPHADLVTLPGDAHLPWHGDGDAVLRAVAPFLGIEGPPAPASGADAGALGELSAREREVLGLAAQGLSDARIAERLVISPHTVHRHMANILAKLRQPTRAAAAAAAARAGLL